MVSSFFYFGMLVALQLHLRINERLKRNLFQINNIKKNFNRNNLKMQLYCNLSDEIDKLSLMYCEVETFSKEINTTFYSTNTVYYKQRIFFYVSTSKLRKLNFKYCHLINILFIF